MSLSARFEAVEAATRAIAAQHSNLQWPETEEVICGDWEYRAKKAVIERGCARPYDNNAGTKGFRSTSGATSLRDEWMRMSDETNGRSSLDEYLDEY